MRVREPTADWHGVLWVEYVGCWRVVDDDGIFQIASNLRQILNIVALMVIATLPEKAMMDNFMNIQLIQKGISVLQHCISGATREKNMGWDIP